MSAAIPGSDNTSLSRIERGIRPMPLEWAEAYADALGYEVVLVSKEASADSAAIDVQRLDFDDRLLLARLARVMGTMPRALKRVMAAQVEIFEAEQDLSLVRERRD